MKYLLFIVLFFGGVPVTHAQENENPAKREQRVQALYVAYITQQLNLTENEAQKFWPVQKQYDLEIKAVGKDMPELDRQQDILDVKKKYQERFTRILGSNRTDEFYRKDLEFRKKLIDQLRKIRQERKQNSRRFERN